MGECDEQEGRVVRCDVQKERELLLHSHRPRGRGEGKFASSSGPGRVAKPTTLSLCVQEEHELSPNAQIKDSGDGFIQVPLPDKKQLIGLKFKQKDEGPIFLGKIREQMGGFVPALGGSLH